MSARGLDFGSGMSGFADLMARGHKDRLELERSEVDRAEKMRQFEATRALQERASEYQYPAYTDIAPEMMDIFDPSYLPGLYKEGTQQSPPPKQPPIFDSTGKRVVKSPPPADGPVAVADAGGRTPQGAADQTGGGLTEKRIARARQLGIEILPDGRWRAKGRQGQELLDIFKASLAAQASAFSAGATAGGRVVSPTILPPPRTPGPPRPPKDTTIDALNSRIRAAQIGLDSFGRNGAMMDENLPAMNAYRQEIADATRELKALGKGGTSSSPPSSGSGSSDAEARWQAYRQKVGAKDTPENKSKYFKAIGVQ